MGGVEGHIARLTSRRYAAGEREGEGRVGGRWGNNATSNQARYQKIVNSVTM